MNDAQLTLWCVPATKSTPMCFLALKAETPMVSALDEAKKLLEAWGITYGEGVMFKMHKAPIAGEEIKWRDDETGESERISEIFAKATEPGIICPPRAWFEKRGLIDDADDVGVKKAEVFYRTSIDPLTADWHEKFAELMSSMGAARVAKEKGPLKSDHSDEKTVTFCIIPVTTIAALAVAR